MRVRVIMLLCAVLASCGDEAPSPSDCAVDASGYGDGRWKEPPGDISSPPAYVPSSGALFAFQPSPGARARFRTLWLDADEDVEVNVVVAVAEADNIPEVEIVALVDGLQQPLDGGSGPRHLRLVPAPGEMRSRRIRIGANAIADGAHSLLVAMLSAKYGYLVGGTSFTILKGGTRFPIRPDHASAAKVVAAGEFGAPAYSGRTPLDLTLPLSGITPEGSLPLSLRLQTKPGLGCADRPVSVTAVALVDFEQIPIGDYGPFIRVEVDAAHAAEIDTQLQRLPVDGKRHVLSLVQAQGDGMYSEAPPGTETPWFDMFLFDLGCANWGAK